MITKAIRAQYSCRRKSDFVTWVLKGNIDNAQNVRKIPAILSNHLAREEFFKTNITEAIKYLNIEEKSTKALATLSMNDLVVELSLRLKRIEWQEVRRLKNDPNYADRKDNLLDLKDSLEAILQDIGEE